MKFPLYKPSKAEGQRVLYAIEELYFRKRFGDAVKMADRALDGEISEELRKSLVDYRERCAVRCSVDELQGERGKDLCPKRP